MRAMQRSAEDSLHVAAHATAAAAHAAPVASSVGVARRSAVSVAAAAARSAPVPPGELHPPPLRACTGISQSCTKSPYIPAFTAGQLTSWKA